MVIGGVFGMFVGPIGGLIGYKYPELISSKIVGGRRDRLGG